jgi:hypothetical protein
MKTLAVKTGNIFRPGVLSNGIFSERVCSKCGNKTRHSGFCQRAKFLSLDDWQELVDQVRIQE